MIERRRYPRLKDGVKVIYKIMGVSHEYEVNPLDVGGRGLCLPLKQRIKSGTLLELGLLLPKDKEPFFCLAKVVWQSFQSKKGKDDQDYYETGVEFLRMRLNQRLRIIRYVYSHLEERT